MYSNNETVTNFLRNLNLDAKFMFQNKSFSALYLEVHCWTLS